MQNTSEVDFGSELGRIVCTAAHLEMGSQPLCRTYMVLVKEQKSNRFE